MFYTRIAAALVALAITFGMSSVASAQIAGCECRLGTDCDGDGLGNDEERAFGSDPCLADTDEGGADDRLEFERGTDPLDPTDDDLEATAGGGAHFGCAASDSSSPGPAALGLGLLLFLFGRRRRSGFVASALLVLIAPTAGQAQQNFDVNGFRPMPQRFDHYLSALSAQPIGGDPWSVGLLLSFADSPLVLRDADDEQVAQVVHRHLVGHLNASYSLLGVIELGIDLPIVLHQTGEDPIPGLGTNEIVRSGAGIGDVRVVPKLVLYSDEDEEGRPLAGGLALALALDFYLPTGSRADFQGEGFRFEPRLAADYQWANGARLGINAGYRFREATRYRDIAIDDQLTGALAAAIPVFDALEVVPEIAGAVTVDADPSDAPLEARVAVKWFYSERVLLYVGGGTALVEGAGTPDWRAFWGVDLRGFTVEIERDEEPEALPAEDTDEPGDADGDGIEDADDPCPDLAEDQDGVEDSDGCPDYDNDGDGLADAVDQCPNEPETVNGLDDHDGCPDTAPPAGDPSESTEPK